MALLRGSRWIHLAILPALCAADLDAGDLAREILNILAATGNKP